jgi:hypothetical protein
MFGLQVPNTFVCTVLFNLFLECLLKKTGKANHVVCLSSTMVEIDTRQGKRFIVALGKEVCFSSVQWNAFGIVAGSGSALW